MKTIKYYCPIHIKTILYKELKPEKPAEHVVKFFSDIFGETLDRLKHPEKVVGEMYINSITHGSTPFVDLLDDGPFECKKCKKFYMKEECLAVKE